MQDTQTALHHRNSKLQVSRSKSSTRLEARESQAEGLTTRSGFSPKKKKKHGDYASLGAPCSACQNVALHMCSPLEK